MANIGEALTRARLELSAFDDIERFPRVALFDSCFASAYATYVDHVSEHLEVVLCDALEHVHGLKDVVRPGQSKRLHHGPQVDRAMFFGLHCGHGTTAQLQYFNVSARLKRVLARFAGALPMDYVRPEYVAWS